MDELLTNPLSYHEWGNNIVVSYHYISAVDIYPYISTLCINDRINEVHKENMKADILSSKNPHLMGTIQIIRDTNKNYKVINGEHRLKVIEEIVKTTKDFEMHIMVEIYDISIINETIVDKICKISNNNYIIKEKRDIMCIDIANAMMKDSILKKGIVETSNVNKPRISYNELVSVLKEHIDADKLKLSTDDIIIRIKKINTLISGLSNSKLFGKADPNIQRLIQLEKAKELGFYLNMNCKIPPKSWIPILWRDF